MTARRWFEDPCDLRMAEHVPGDRHWAVGQADTEWDGGVEARVCPGCDRPMGEYDAHSLLWCSACGIRHDQVPVRVAPPEVA